LTNFNPTPIAFIAIGQGKKTLLRRLENIGMASEKLYRNTLNWGGLFSLYRPLDIL